MQLDRTQSVGAVILDETISRNKSPLVVKPLSLESHVPMNLNDNAMKLLESNPVSLRDLPEETHSRVRVEPCEFESLLQRAMEILSVRARSATASSS
jgi:hypothetical protein